MSSSILLTIPTLFVDDPIEKYGIGILSVVSALVHNRVGGRIIVYSDHALIMFLTIYSMTHRVVATLWACCMIMAMKDYRCTYYYARLLPIVLNVMRILIFHRYRIFMALATIAAGSSFNERDCADWTRTERWAWHAASSTYLLMARQV